MKPTYWLAAVVAFGLADCSKEAPPPAPPPKPKTEVKAPTPPAAPPAAPASSGQDAKPAETKK